MLWHQYKIVSIFLFFCTFVFSAFPKCYGEIQKDRNNGQLAIQLAMQNQCVDFSKKIGEIDLSGVRNAVNWYVGIRGSSCVKLEELIDLFYLQKKKNQINSILVNSIVSFIMGKVSHASNLEKERISLLAEDLLQMDDENLVGLDSKISLVRMIKITSKDKSVFLKNLNKVWSSTLFTKEKWIKFVSNYGQYLNEESCFRNIQIMILNGNTNFIKNYVSKIQNPNMLKALNAGIKITNGLNKKESLKLVDRSDDGFLTALILEFQKDITLEEKIALIKNLQQNPKIGCTLFCKNAIQVVREMIGSVGEPLYPLLDWTVDLKGNALAEYYLFAGWVAMEIDKRSDIGLKYFKKVSRIETDPTIEAKNYYWLGVANLKLGNKQSAKNAFMIAARNSFSFYGQLSLNQLGLNPSIVSSNRLKEINSKFNACNFLHTDMMVELGYISYKKQNKWCAIKYLEDAISRAIKNGINVCYLHSALSFLDRDFKFYIGKKITAMNMPIWKISFPNTTHAKDSLVNAIVKQESIFSDKAISPKGALGIMQIMSRTAKHIADGMGMSHHDNYALQDKTHNLKIGREFLYQLSKRYKSLPVLVAAYNAGSGRVSRWISRFGDPGQDLSKIPNWIESIPYKETRNYIVAILEAKTVYDELDIPTDVI